MLGLLSHTCRNGKSSLILVMRVEVQRAVVKFSFPILRALWSLGMPPVLLSCCLLSPEEKVVSPSRYWHIPGFVPAMPVTTF